MQIGDVVLYRGERYEILWIYNETRLEIKYLKKSAIPTIIPVNTSEVTPVL